MFRTVVRNNGLRIAKRHLSLHEYRSAELLRKYDIGTPNGIAVGTPQEAILAADKLFSSRLSKDNGDNGSSAGSSLVLKAQALTGGRGKGHFANGLQSGIHFINNSKEAGDLSLKMLGEKLITKQTGEEGKLVSKVYLVDQCKVVHESYLSIIMDRSSKKNIIVASPKGGMNIEEVAHSQPEYIFKYYIAPNEVLTHEKAMEISEKLGFSKEVLEDSAETIIKLYKLFQERDSSLIEINPLAECVDETVEGKNKVMCIDAKFGFDDNAEFRQKEIFEWRDLTQEDPEEIIAKKNDLNFIKLNGNIGCLVNGAGLAMATMDVIKLYGGKPANFLDCGGGATPETIEIAFKLITSNPEVKAIFVNIFGGIVRCDYVAEGLVAASKSLDLKIPVIVRLQGTNLELGKQIIEKSGLKIYSFDELDPAAKKAVECSL